MAGAGRQPPSADAALQGHNARVVLVVLVVAERSHQRQAVDEDDHGHEDEDDLDHGGPGVVDLTGE